MKMFAQQLMFGNKIVGTAADRKRRTEEGPQSAPANGGAAENGGRTVSFVSFLLFFVLALL